jgi:intein-encoded DNA endonuclease-like protein
MISYEEAKAAYLSGESLSSIKSRTGFNRRKLAKLLKRENIEIVLNNQQFTYNETFFDVIDTEEKAYWLGFLFADGYVSISPKHIVELCLAESDRTHVEKFRDIMCREKPVAYKESKQNGKVFGAYRFSIINKYMVNKLVMLGCTPRKSLSLRMPEIGKDVKRHFIRGYFDGDGSLGLYGCKASAGICCGSKEFLLELQNILSEEVLNFTQVKVLNSRRTPNVYSFTKGGKDSVIVWLDYMYEGSTVHLNRKYEKYLSIKSHFAVPSEMEEIINGELSVKAVKP